MLNNKNLRCPGGIEGKVSVLGVVQFTPDPFLLAFVTKVLSSAVKAHKKCPVRLGKLSITRSNWNNGTNDNKIYATLKC